MDTIMLHLSDSDNEDENCIQIRRERRNLRNNSKDILEMDDYNFFKNFRINKGAFIYILEEYENVCGNDKRQGSLSPKIKLAACLRFFATGNYQHCVGKDFNINVAQSTFCGILEEVLNILEYRLCSRRISIYMNENEELESKTFFFAKSKIPGVTVAVDGTHIKIMAPTRDKHLYYNRKGFSSLNVMIVCDHKMQIRYVSAKYPGSSHDSHIWDLSDIKTISATNYRRGNPNLILGEKPLIKVQSPNKNVRIKGDKGYPLQPWLITPFREPITCLRKRRFNTNHAKGRIIFEKTIGLLKSVFRCLCSERGLHYAPYKAARIVNFCCALHNIRLHFNSNENFNEPHLDISENEYSNNDDNDLNDMPTDEANRKRETFSDMF
ncbi:putative nuclease HARBI1 isoform X5 [Bactrocera neohumeralis]|uniref:putative nuclease HARBI1 isoform X3 n=1 Tax=Bactrocera neohumeralis TaxID=98809 RepID=UPI0021667D9A|nr:putative nuclease HARBI1 isoform X3 [Bactrocera neohumeralis]XP_050338452.1 putative nuclease HARBI1 isoform X4 [Bactrocera neohumeralis]XP_050338454.1 putative nuclease HARBI1 isoform X5 [Bactrocera neohumeralis]